MDKYLYTSLVIIAGCSVFSACIPFLGEQSDEARRMFTVVKSARVDSRKVRGMEQISGKIMDVVSALKAKLGVSGSAAQVTTFSASGMKGRRVTDVYRGLRVLLLVAGVAVAMMLPRHRLLFLLLLISTVYILPRLWWHRKRKERRERIRRSLPNVMDLLVISVEAGLGMEQALLRIGQDLAISHPEMADELERVALERQAGSSRSEAWKSLSERLALQELTEFTNLLAEADRFGTPIARALNDFSQRLRTRRRQRAEEAAAKLKVKIIFPLVLCIFPCTFVILLGPALLNLGRSFSNVMH